MYKIHVLFYVFPDFFPINNQYNDDLFSKYLSRVYYVQSILLKTINVQRKCLPS